MESFTKVLLILTVVFGVLSMDVKGARVLKGSDVQQVDQPQTFGSFGGNFPNPFGGFLPRPSFGGNLPNPGFGGSFPRPGFGGNIPRSGFGGNFPNPGFGGSLPSSVVTSSP
ncbi:hypothetical protein BUALT_Bualt19G0076000 [Buddleja alternifolia]|uniref:Uncharacterized protein n=1 Tax=Buddleja alternifolia TaxID=168488 RepID=A0AAV6W2Q3_9LAMI|nr:hypothetical protein BUALT_Bualt19G0076000 [Buddleja alternifolia]